MTGLDLLAPDQRGLFIGGTWREADAAPASTSSTRPTGRSSPTSPTAASATRSRRSTRPPRPRPTGPRTPPRERGEILRRAFELITARADDFAQLMSLEMGKTVAEARGEVAYGAEFFRWYAEEAVRIHGRWMQAPAGGSRLLTIKKPVGPCLFITPWNFPLAMGTRKIGPAVAAGCTMVVKPAELRPR